MIDLLKRGDKMMGKGGERAAFSSWVLYIVHVFLQSGQSYKPGRTC